MAARKTKVNFLLRSSLVSPRLGNCILLCASSYSRNGISKLKFPEEDKQDGQGPGAPVT